MLRHCIHRSLVVALLVVPAGARAFTNDSASIALHLIPVHAGPACNTSAVAPSCSNIVTRGSLNQPYFAYLLVTHGDPDRGIAGLQCGIRYNPKREHGIDVAQYNACATIDFSSTDWPASGGGDIITWSATRACQRYEPGGPGTGVVAVAGYFYLSAYSADRMDVIPRPIDGSAKVADCDASEYVLADATTQHTPNPLGSLTFSDGGTAPGYNPCAATDAGPCEIAGPTEAVEGQEGLRYSVGRLTAADGIHWSISGNGLITSGVSDTVVTVNAGEVGAFFLAVTSADHAIACEFSVAVTPVPCGVTGPDFVTAHQVNLEYAAVAPVPGESYAWTISGNGALAGPADGPTVRVTAGNPGAFQLGLQITRSGLSHSCARGFTVVDPGQCPASQASARILIHLRAATTRNACTAGSEPACPAVVTAGALYPTTYFGYLLVCNGSALAGVAGVECGLQYDGGAHSGVDVYSWSLCGTLEFKTPDWPAPGSGNRITWEATAACQRHEPGGAGTGVTANAGYFYLAAYSPDQLAVRPHPLTGEAKLADCTACESVIARTADGLYPNLGTARFTADGATNGFNPCGAVVPVLTTTWSSIKAYYREGSSPH